MNLGMCYKGTKRENQLDFSSTSVCLGIRCCEYNIKSSLPFLFSHILGNDYPLEPRLDPLDTIFEMVECHG